jgi:hypothetical protein
MVIPHAQQFSTRSFAGEATKRCVRTLSYRFNLPVESVSEYRLDAITAPPPLIVVPSPRVLNTAAWASLRKLAEQGSTLLVTGAFDADDHFLPTGRLATLGLAARNRPVAQEEFLTIDGVEHRLGFRGNKLQRLEAAIVDAPAAVVVRPLGRGSVVWSPLPVELAESPDPTAALYRFALKQAKVTPELSVGATDPPVLVLPTMFEDVLFITCVSETSRDTELTLRLRESSADVRVRIPAGRTSLMFVRRRDGTVLSSL